MPYRPYTISSFLDDESLHGGSVVDFIFIPLACTDEIGVQFGMLFTKLDGFFKPHHHEGCSISIGRSTILGYGRS